MNARDPLLDVALAKGTDRRMWYIGPAAMTDRITFHRSAPGTVSHGALATDEAVEAKRREFQAEIARARGEGWV